MAYYPTGNPDVDRLIDEYSSREIIVERSRTMPGDVRFNIVLMCSPILSFPFSSSAHFLIEFLNGRRNAFGDRGTRLCYRDGKIEILLEYYHVITVLTDRQSLAILTKLRILYDLDK